jgi:hypothetical protein
MPEVVYKKTKDSWGTKAIIDGREFIFEPLTTSKKVLRKLTKNIFDEDTDKKPVNVFDLFSKETQEVWAMAKKISGNRKSNKFLGADIFFAISSHPGLTEIFDRLEFSIPAGKTITLNYLKLAGEPKFEDLSKLPFLALEESMKLHAHNIHPIVLMYALMHVTKEDDIVQAIFANLDLTPQKMEMLACWMLDLNYQFPEGSEEQSFLECCQKLKIIEEHNKCMFTYPAVKLALSKNLGKAENTKILVKAALEGKRLGKNIIKEELVKKVQSFS